MGGTVTEVPAEERPHRKSFLARFAGVFISPGDTFADIARAPDFLLPIITMTALSVAFTESMLAKIGMERIIRNAIEQSGRASQMSPEQMQQAVERGASIGAIVSHIFGVIGVPIFVLIVAALGLLFTNVFFGAQVGFKKALSAASYAHLVSALFLLMAIAMVFFGDPAHFNPELPVPSNPGFFLDPSEVSKPLFALARSLDVFTLWFIVLLGIAFAAATERKVKALPIFFCYFGLWLIVVLGRVVWAFIM